MPDANISMERRVNPRIAIKIPVKYRLEEDKEVVKTIEEWRNTQKHAHTLDMSLSGMSIILDHYLAMGTILRFDVYLLDKVNVATIYAEVKWVNPNGTGVKFLMMKDKELEALKMFLEKSSAG
jgi:hypothetical protein